MKNYISCKLIQAEPSIKDGVEGYSILYRDGYKSWCPKEQFEKANLQIDKNEKLASGVILNKRLKQMFKLEDGRLWRKKQKSPLLKQPLNY